MRKPNNVVHLMSQEEREAWGRHERAYQAVSDLPPIEKMALMQALIVDVLAECDQQNLSSLLRDLRRTHIKINGDGEVRRLRNAIK